MLSEKIMSKIRIVTDSSITIEPELVKKYNITVVPLSVMVDGVIYSDSDLREEGRFLEMMKHSKELPKTRRCRTNCGNPHYAHTLWDM